MQIIKNRQIVADNWSYISDDVDLPKAGDITVSLKRWLTEKDSLQIHNGQVGVRLNSTDAVQNLAADLNNLPLIELNFGFFGDGRIFSQAKLLRTRLGYQNEIRAVGNFMLDQVFYLSKVGVNAFVLANEQQLPVALTTLDDISVSYQAA